MSGFLPNIAQTLRNKTNISTKSMEGFLTTLFRVKKRPSLLRLYDSIETLPILRFFQIMKTKDLTLLVESNPLSQKPNEENLQQTWDTILEQYYRIANPKKYKDQLRKAVKVEGIRNRIVLLSSALTLSELGFAEGDEVLKMEGTTAERAESKINSEKTMLNMVLLEFNNSEKEAEVKEEMNFWRTIATVERGLGRSLDVEKISVARWIEIINDLKEHYKQLNNGRRKNSKV